MTQSRQTVTGVLTATSDCLASKGIDHPRLACELLLSRMLGCKRLELYVEPDRVLDSVNVEVLWQGVTRIAGGEPVQYVVGTADFMGYTFKVDRRALIPRPETETLVEEVLRCDTVWRGDGLASVVDVGTGCGCIAISLALARPRVRCLALDISGVTLDLARENAVDHGVTDRVTFACSELGDAVAPRSVDAVVANLPYIPTLEYKKLPVHIHDHEPRLALDGGPSGLCVIESVVRHAAITLKVGGRLFLEIGGQQAGTVVSFLANVGCRDIRTVKDLAGRDRVVRGSVGRLYYEPKSGS